MFDEEHFIRTLANDVKIVKKLPKELMTTAKAVIHFRSWSGLDYYQDEISRKWDNYQVYLLEHGSSFLSFYQDSAMLMFLIEMLLPAGYQSC